MARNRTTNKPGARKTKRRRTRRVAPDGGGSGGLTSSELGGGRGGKPDNKALVLAAVLECLTISVSKHLQLCKFCVLIRIFFRASIVEFILLAAAARPTETNVFLQCRHWQSFYVFLRHAYWPVFAVRVPCKVVACLYLLGQEVPYWAARLGHARLNLQHLPCRYTGEGSFGHDPLFPSCTCGG